MHTIDLNDDSSYDNSQSQQSSNQDDIQNDKSSSTQSQQSDVDIDKNTNSNADSNASNSDTNSTSISIESEDGNTVEYILDANGNATLNGEIVYDRQTLIDNGFEFPNADTTSSSNEPSIVDSIQAISGITLEDEEGNPLSFTDDAEGLANREVAIKNTFYNKGRQEALEAFYEENPDIYKMAIHKQKYGTLDNFTQQSNISDLTITAETDVATLKHIYKSYLIAKGNDEAVADKLIKLSEVDETLRIDASNALDSLKAIEQAEEAEYMESVKQQQIQTEQKRLEYYGFKLNEKGEIVDVNKEGSMYDKIVKSGKVGNIVIPKEGLTIERDGKKTKLSRVDVLAYFYNPIETPDGVYTLAQIEERRRLENKDNWIIQGIKNLVGDDITKLEKALGNSIKISNLKKSIKIKGSSTQRSSDSKSTGGSRRIVFD